MTYDYKLARAKHYRAKRGKRRLGWLAFGIVVASLTAGGLALTASRADAAGGGRVQPAIAPASATFVRLVAERMGHLPVRALFQSCMGSKCAVFTMDGGNVVTLVRRDGAWRVASMVGGDGAFSQGLS